MQGIRKWGKKLIIIAIAILMVLPLNVLAEDEITNEFVGAKVASPGETISYEIKVKANALIKSYETDLHYDSTVLDMISIENKGSWKGSNIPGSSPNGLTFTHTGISGETVVAKVTFKVKADTTKSNATIKLDFSRVKLEDGTELPIEVPSTLKFDIKATDNTLKSLTINDKIIANFKASTYSYAMQVDSNSQIVKIGAVLNNNSASFVKDFGPRSVEVDYGETELLIKVLSEAGEEKVYTVVVTRMDNRENNNYLKSLIINSGKIKLDFDKDRTAYNITTYRQKKIDVDAVSEDGKATVVVDAPEEFVMGSNTVKITVTSESKEEKLYTLTVDNRDEDVNTYLRVLSVGGYVIDFYQKTFDYEIRYNSKYSGGLEIIKASELDEYSGVRIDEGLLTETNKNLKPGSVVKVRVYFDDSHETIYTITLVKDTRINFFLILGIIVLIILVVVLIRVLKMRKKEKLMAEKVEELSKTKEIKIEKNHKE